MLNDLLPTNFLFRFSFPCRYANKAGKPDCPVLDETYALPHFSALDKTPTLADVRLAWSDAGLTLNLQVSGRQTPLDFNWRDTLANDNIQLFVDTRDTHNVHRATRFCHRFAFMPRKSEGKAAGGNALLLAINRARESPRGIPDQTLSVRVDYKKDGYLLQGTIPAAAITGFDPSEHPRLGFYYYVLDQELGRQFLTLNQTFNVLEDPSMWSTIELVKE